MDFFGCDGSNTLDIGREGELLNNIKIQLLQTAIKIHSRWNNGNQVYVMESYIGFSLVWITKSIGGSSFLL